MDLNEFSGSWINRRTSSLIGQTTRLDEGITLAGADAGFMVHRVECTYFFHVSTALTDMTRVEFDVAATIGVNPTPNAGAPQDFTKSYWSDVMGWAPERTAAPGTGVGQANRGFVRLRRQEDHSYYAGPNELIWFSMEQVPIFVPDEGFSVNYGMNIRAFISGIN